MTTYKKQTKTKNLRNRLMAIYWQSSSTVWKVSETVTNTMLDGDNFSYIGNGIYAPCVINSETPKVEGATVKITGIGVAAALTETSYYAGQGFDVVTEILGDSFTLKGFKPPKTSGYVNQDTRILEWVQEHVAEIYTVVTDEVGEEMVVAYVDRMQHYTKKGEDLRTIVLSIIGEGEKHKFNSDELWEWESQGYKGYICGFHIDDGAAGFMRLLNEEGDTYVLVDFSCLTKVGVE